jgi:uncharacterized phage-associated protein
MMTMPNESQIRHSDSNRIDTVRDVASSDESVKEAHMTTTAPPLAVQQTSPWQRVRTPNRSPYPAPMTSVNSVITAIDARRPGMKPAKKQLLLFFAQGHHLAWADEPLFAEALYATERGVALQTTGLEEATPITSEALLGTISNVVVRYSGLSPSDLRTLVQASLPWQLARKAGDDARIEWTWLTDWFRRSDETDDPDDERPNRAERAEAEAYLASRGRP